MRSFSKPAVFGLLWLTFAAAAFGANGLPVPAQSIPEPVTYALAGIGLIVLSLFRRRKPQR